MTYDTAAIQIMLSNDTDRQKARRLAKLALEAEQRMGARCPECSAGDDQIESNAPGCSYANSVTYRCSCGHEWGPGVDG